MPVGSKKARPHGDAPITVPYEASRSAGPVVPSNRVFLAPDPICSPVLGEQEQETRQGQGRSYSDHRATVPRDGSRYAGAINGEEGALRTRPPLSGAFSAKSKERAPGGTRPAASHSLGPQATRAAWYHRTGCLCHPAHAAVHPSWMKSSTRPVRVSAVPTPTIARPSHGTEADTPEQSAVRRARSRRVLLLLGVRMDASEVEAPRSSRAGARNTLDTSRPYLVEKLSSTSLFGQSAKNAPNQQRMERVQWWGSRGGQMLAIVSDVRRPSGVA